MLEPDPALRPTATQLLNYPFFRLSQVAEVGNIFVAENTPILAHKWLQVDAEQVRVKTIESIIDISLQFKLSFTTFCRSVHIVDAYCVQRAIEPSSSRAVAASSLLIAGKLEERFPPELADYVFVGNRAYTNEVLRDLERNVLRTVTAEQLVGPLVADFSGTGEIVQFLAMIVLCYGYQLLLETQCTPFHLGITLQEMANDVVRGDPVVVPASSLEYRIQGLINQHRLDPLAEPFTGIRTGWHTKWRKWNDQWRSVYVLQ